MKGRKLDTSTMNKTTGENEMVGVGLFLEEEIKQEPMYILVEGLDIPHFSANNDPLNIKSEDVSMNNGDIDFSANNDPLNIKSEGVDIVLDSESISGSVLLNMVLKSTKDNMVGEIIEGIDSIKQEENDRDALVEERSQTTSGLFKSHDNMFDANRGKLTCELCGSSFSSRNGLGSYKIVHKDPSELCMYKFENCAYETKYKSCLKTHTLNRHSSLKKFSCEMCDYKSNNKHVFRKHLIQHSLPLANTKEKKDYKCQSCEYTSKNKHCMDRHSKVHKSPSELTMEKCHLCPYQSKSYGLASHMLCHKSSSETRLYKCELFIRDKMETLSKESY